MRWIVGIDERDTSRGALELAVWLREHARAPHQQELFGVHVVDDHFRTPVSADVRAQLVASAAAATERGLATLGTPSPLAELHVELDAPVEDVLERYADVLAADVLLLGRIGAREVQGVTRLGRVARRLLRTLPRAVAIVPPDLRRASIGNGPVLLATDLGDDSSTAGKLARRLAASIGRDLAIVYVDTMIDHPRPGADPLPHPGLTDLAAWARGQELEPARIRVQHGDVVDKVLAVATEEHAAMIVAGSRRLTLAERIFGASVGTDLARVADRPVLVVPPE